MEKLETGGNCDNVSKLLGFVGVLRLVSGVLPFLVLLMIPLPLIRLLFPFMMSRSSLSSGECNDVDVDVFDRLRLLTRSLPVPNVDVDELVLLERLVEEELDDEDNDNDGC